MEVFYTVSHGHDAASFFDPLVDLYARVYVEPPYEEHSDQFSRFRDRLPDEADRPGFTLVTATVDSTLAGAAYGWTMPAGDWWSRADGDPPIEIRAAVKLAVMEWIVHPHRRGAGVGAGLMRRLLADRSERYATLASDPRSSARQVYARNGWRQVGTSVLPWGPPMDLLVLDLRPERAR
ncbi:GNAT family N-acetyltransferase [Micromonospora sp. WMMD1120]|uniref:GNAT family N-acetyltransferase n=1 Tax=Micromonospora sp. WMMD1120 TaxID=3016106 RepID=UPI002416F4CA|nr:GNAT family N-acetyltransferase [Micromonospora sp. WMMD1120]MDG4810456.1 GNAT family N-acetyltransferase [Micromonospora sp. WMMD1120]